MGLEIQFRLKQQLLQFVFKIIIHKYHLSVIYRVVGKESARPARVRPPSAAAEDVRANLSVAHVAQLFCHLTPSLISRMTDREILKLLSNILL